MELNKNTMIKLFLLCVCVLLVFLAFQNLDTVSSFLNWLLVVLTPFIIAGCFTFFLNVPLKAIEKHLFRSKDGKPVSEFKEKARRPIAIALSIGIFVIIIGVFLTIIIPEIINSMQTIADSIPGFFQNVQKEIIKIGEENEYIKQFFEQNEIDWQMITNKTINYLQSNVGNFTNFIMNLITTVVGTVVNIFLGIVISIYTLMKKEKLSSDIKKVLYSVLPVKHADFIVELGHLTNQSFYKSITGQMTECVIIGSLTALGMTIFGFPYAALIGVLIAILSWIPMFGVGIGIIIGALFLLTTDPMEAIWFVIFMICLQQIEGNFIFPRVVGSNMGLPPLIMVSAITLFASFFGVIGLLVCGPVTSVLYTLLKRFVFTKLNERKIPKEKYRTIYDKIPEKDDKMFKKHTEPSQSSFFRKTKPKK